MLRKQIFKTLAGAQKRVRFENAHCDGRYRYSAVRCLDGERDTAEFDVLRSDFAPGNHPASKYTWRLERATRC